MQIIKKEAIEFSERETDAINLVIQMCESLEREANNPNLRNLANTIWEKLAELCDDYEEV